MELSLEQRRGESQVVTQNGDMNNRQFSETTEAQCFSNDPAFHAHPFHSGFGLANNEEIFSILINNIPDVIWISGETGSRTFISPNIQKISGYTPKEIYEGGEKFWFKSIHPDDRNRVIEAQHDLINSTGRFDMEYRLKKKDGAMLWIHDRAFTNYSRDGHMIACGIFSDITERKRLEEELLKMHKLESVGILAGGIAHDFNNLLGAILGNISVAKIFTNSDMRVNDLLNRAEEACDMAKDLSYRLLTFAKGGDPLRRTMDIKDLLQSSIRLSLTGSSIRADFSIAEELFPVEIDEGQIRQVLNNLVLNAKEAMPEGGSVSIRAENIYLSGNQQIPLKKGNYLRISFQDYGIGIPENILNKIFDPYFSTKGLGSKKGQGLGLTICHSIVKHHGGLVTVDSWPGFGTTFHIYLPASAEWHRPGKSSISSSVRSHKKRILVMDDDENIRYTLKQMLLHLGYAVTGTCNSEETISAYRSAMLKKKPYHYVMLDLTIQGGTGGEKTMSELKGLDPSVKGIISSGYAHDPVMTHYEDYNFIAAIAKPFTFEKLSTLLKDLEKHQ